MPNYVVIVERVVRERHFVTADNFLDAEDMAILSEDGGDEFDSQVNSAEATLAKENDDA